MKDLIWMGIRQSEIVYSNFINDSITLFGNNDKSMESKMNKRINHNDEKNFGLIDSFYDEAITKQIEINHNSKFMYYSQIYSYESIKKLGLLDYMICLNDPNLIEFINSKFKIKEYLKNYIPILNYEYVNRSNYNFEELKNKFGTNEFVIQTEEGSGGFGTSILNENNKEKIQLENNQEYMITKYCKGNIPVNIHVLISRNDIELLPVSIQNIELIQDKLAYKGCDFIAYRNIIEHKIDLKLKEYAFTIGKLMQEKGYRGILGIDSIIYENEIYFMEINPRFQNSSTILNKSLKENNLISLQELNYNCFYGGNINLPKFDVDYSAYINEFDIINNKIDVEPVVSLDMPNKECMQERFSYLSTDIYNKSIYDSLK